MVLLNTEQMRAWDAYTISHDGISSVELMHRASMACSKWICKKSKPCKVSIYAGMGNNGGDGIALAALLYFAQYEVELMIVHHQDHFSPDAAFYFERLPPEILVLHIDHEVILPTENTHIIIDAMLGAGANRPLNGILAATVAALSKLSVHKISIDVPSGLRGDFFELGADEHIFQADTTLTFQTLKPSMLLPDTGSFAGQVIVLDIELNKEYLQTVQGPFYIQGHHTIKDLYKPRKKFSHKGTYGHALLICGSQAKLGAAVLAASGCIKSGAGLTTLWIADDTMPHLYNSLPEVMLYDGAALTQFSAIGIGCGIGQGEDAVNKLELTLTSQKPLVLDANAINLLPKLMDRGCKIPAHTILTPHVKEFERLTGMQYSSSYARLQAAMAFALAHQVYIILKGAYTAICEPNGYCTFNTSGNPGMAKGGSGDVLAGMITALLAQGHLSADAAKLAVYIHGDAGDLAAKKYGQQAMLPSDLINRLPKAWEQIS
jgi:NAD(P)H-hydrate epimerase